MSSYFFGQIMLAGFDYAPVDWALANGQSLPIAQNQALFALVGTLYGGDGLTTFLLPDLRGRTPIGQGIVPLAQRGGVEAVTLTPAQMPPHQHAVNGSRARATSADPSGRTFAVRRSGNGYASPATPGLSTAAAAAVTSEGGNQPHSNMQPYLTVNFCICINGFFPSRF